MIDIHLHTQFSFDSEELPESYISEAKNRNIPVIGFSDHYDYDAYLDGEGEEHLADIDSIMAKVNELRKNNKDIEILCGIEFGYSKASAKEYERLADIYPFDYIINSVHTVPERGDCYYDDFFKNKTLKESYTDYFNAVLESVKCEFDYQIVGHIGYVSRYRTGEGARIFYSDYADIIDEILKEIIKRDKCLELNTSVGKAQSEFLPDCDIIKRYLQLGGRKMSFGSDAHNIAKYLNKCENLTKFLKSLGIDELYYYKNRKPIAYKI